MNESFIVVFSLLAQTIHGEQSVSFVDFSDNRIMGLELGCKFMKKSQVAVYAYNPP